MRVIVTGSHGFVGRHFVRRFLDLGHEVTAVDDMSAGLPASQWMFKPKRLIHEIKFYQEDLRKFVQRQTPRPDHFDLVVHCAAVVGGRLKIEGDPLAVATDLSIDAELFNWIAKCKTRRPKLIYFSSSAVYPIELQTQSAHVALCESMTSLDTTRIGMPDMTYGWAKLTGEMLAKHAVEKYGMEVVIYRPFSGYGEDQDVSYPFPNLIKRALAKENPLVVWGSGTQVRDFIHIDDVVGAVMETKDKMFSGQVMNLGTGRGVAFCYFVQLLRDITGRAITMETDLTKPEGVHSRVADTFQLDAYYKAKVSLEEGIRRALDRPKKRV